MKKLLLVLTTFYTVIVVQGQNLVPNPSFEITTFCEPQVCYIWAGKGADGWDTYRGSSDYFNTCNSGSPNNGFGNQTASTGTAYAGFYAYVDTLFGSIVNIREYLGTQLLTPLIIGETYFVSVKFSLAENYPQLACNKLGVLFLNNSYSSLSSTSCGAPGTCSTCLNYIPNYAHVYTDSIITNYTGWAEVSGYFVADSAYTNIAIGNFFEDTYTTRQIVLPANAGVGYSYYFVDDISVTQSDTLSGIQVVAKNNYLRIFPNPFSSQTTLQSDRFLKNASLIVCNLYGQTIKQIDNLSGHTIIFNRDNLPSGLYFIRLMQDNKIFTSDKFAIIDN